MAYPPFLCENIVQGYEILEYLSDIEQMRENDHDEFEENREEYEAVKAFRDEVGGSDYDFSGYSFIADHHWGNYAAEAAEDAFELRRSGAYTWFDYDGFAEDLGADYQTADYENTTYYYQ